MRWKNTDVMTEKERFVMLAQSGHFTLTDLCADFGISRKTGHKYLSRYAADGRSGFEAEGLFAADLPAMLRTHPQHFA